MLDKSKYQNKESIGEGVRKGADDYFKSVKKGKGIPDTAVQRVFRRRIEKEK